MISKIPIKCNKTSVINISKNPIQYSRTKHINIRHYFIHGHVLNSDIVLEFVRIEDQLTDIFTKPLDGENFSSIRRRLRMIELLV